MESRLVGAWQTSSSPNSDRVENIGRRLLVARSEEIGGGIRRLLIASVSLKSSAGNPPTSSSDSNPGMAGFQIVDTTVIIVIAVLVVALVCAAIVNSLMRCALRRRSQAEINARAMLVAQGGDLGDEDSSEQGLDASTLASLPVLAFKSSKYSKPAEVDCTICLSEFTENERLRLLPRCSHVFHIDCIDLWFLSNNSCPVCRDGVKADPESALKLDQDLEAGESMVLTLDQDGHPAVVRRCASLRKPGGVTEIGEITMDVRAELKRDKSWSASMSDATRFTTGMRSLSMDHLSQATFQDGSRSGRAGSSSRSSLRAAISAILSTSGARSSSARWPGPSSSFRGGSASLAALGAAPSVSARWRALTSERPEAATGSLAANEPPLASLKTSSPGQ